MTIIIAILNYLLGVGQYSPEADSYSIRASISSILNTMVIIIAQLIIARGLLVNRMGTVGEYLENINYLNFKVFAVCALVQIIPVRAIFVIGTSILGGVAISGAISDGFEGMGFSIVMAILFTVALLIYGLFAFYEYFVAVDNKDLSFGQIFKVGKDLISETFKILFVQIILPIIVYIIIVILLISNIKGSSALAIVGLLTIVFSIYMIIVTVKVLARLSDAYLDYKTSHNKENDEIVYEE